MLPLFTVRIAEWSPVCKRAVHSVYCARLYFCMCPPFPFHLGDGMWDLIVLIPDHFLFIYLMDFAMLKN